MKNVFQKEVTQELINRLNKLTPATQAEWGKMSVDQMIAHCNVAYDMTFTNKYPKPKGLKKFIIKVLAKNAVVSEKPYPKNARTAPEFIINDKRNFNQEKEKLTNYLNKVQVLGEAHFNGKESHSFGKLTSTEWNNMFYKHLDHHLTQFGV